MNIINDDFFITNMEITNNDDLRDKIHEIHNYMRNNGIGYGLSSLKVFNFLYGLMKVEGYKLTEKVKFSELLKLANENSNKISERLDQFLDIICKDENSEIKELLFYEIPNDIRDEVYNNLIKEIYNIKNVEKSSQELLSGKIYEYFIGRDQTAISELGAYFTNRRIVNFILEKIGPKIKSDGNIPKMIDMFGGSGGFTTGYMNYLNKYNKIDWKSQLDRIYHYDINSDVLKAAALELLCLSDGIIPKIGKNMNIQKINSFKHNFHSENKFDLILTNPPYGGDKKATTGKKDKRDKIKNYIKTELLILEKDKENNKEVIFHRKEQLKEIEAEDKIEKKMNDSQTVNLNSCSLRIIKFGSDNKLVANDKEACSLILMMELLEKEGTAVGVLKEGLFFDGKYKELRKCLIEKYNIKEIISVPQNQFENTSTKTSIIIFSNTEIKTTEIKFSELIVELYENDKFIIHNNEVKLLYLKGDIKEVKETKISSVSVETIKKHESYSLNQKEYNKKEIIVGKDFKLVKLGNISTIKNGKQLDKKNIINGIYPVYSGGLKPIGYHNIYNNENATIIAGTGRCGFVQFDDSKFYASQCFTIKSDNILLNKYLFIICKSLENIFMNSSKGSCQNFIRSSTFIDMLIPIPKTEELINKWVDKILGPYEMKQVKEIRLKELEEEIKNKIKNIQENNECEEIKLGDIIDTKSGRYITKDKFIKGKYPVYGGGNITNYINIYNRENELIINKDGLSLNCVRYENDKFFLNHHGWTLIYKQENYKKIINYYLLNNKQIIYNIANGSNQKGINKNKFLELKIKLPKDKSLIDNLQPIFNEIEELQKEIKELDKTYNNQLKELRKDAIINYTDIIINDDIIDIKDDINDDIIDINDDIKDDIIDDINDDINDDIINKNEDLQKLTIPELKEKCKEKGFKGYSKMKKDELIDIINKNN